MIGPYKPSYTSVMYRTRPIESILQPSPLEQKLLGDLDHFVRKAAETINNYQTYISNNLNYVGSILFSKKGRELQKRKRRKLLDEKKTAKKKRMENPGRESKYAKKKRRRKDGETSGNQGDETYNLQPVY